MGENVNFITKENMFMSAMEANSKLAIAEKVYADVFSILQNNILQTGAQVVADDTSENKSRINSLIMTTFGDKPVKTNWNHMASYPERLFFVGEKSIMEVHFEDTLPVVPVWKFIAADAGLIQVELTFKSERVKLVGERVKQNKFRFVYSRQSDKVTCRRMTE